MPRWECLYLTPAERDVLRALVRSRSVADVALARDRKVATVRAQVRELHRKTGTHTFVDLVLFGVEHWSCCTAGDR